MGIFNTLMHKKMLKEAKKMAKEMYSLYWETKREFPSLSEKEIIIRTHFNPDTFERMPESSKKRVSICCETVNGLCYMMALDVGIFKGLMNFRSLQFTKYMDTELEKLNIPRQTKEQKERILEAMELKIDGWEKYVP